ncbi:MAG: MATE family efflux transporter, partial [Pseudomonadota bacterium]
MTAARLTRTKTLALAWPIILAQAATATTGIVDTAVMGRFGTASDLAAVGVAAVVFSFVYWGFGFLRMATTGLTAQADGADNDLEARAILVRALLLAG